MSENEKKRVNFWVDKEKWERFKKVAKHNHSDASKEMNKFVDKYLSENSQLALKIQDK